MFHVFLFFKQVNTDLLVVPVYNQICTEITLFSGSVYYLQDLQIFFFNNFLLKINFIVLFTYLKIILLLCIQFLTFNKINYIQTDFKVAAFNRHLMLEKIGGFEGHARENDEQRHRTRSPTK